MKTFNTFKEANEASKQIVKDNPGRMIFIMSKGNKHAVIIGWDGRDEALKNGWRFS